MMSDVANNLDILAIERSIILIQQNYFQIYICN